MATKKQIKANRANAQHSTGPRSAEGKAASSQNALKSGVPSGPDAKSQIIRGEDPAALDALAGQYLLDHQPQSAAERALVDILVDSEWLLRRLRKTEAQLWQYDLAGIDRQNLESFNRNNPTPEDQLLGLSFIRKQETLARLERRRESLQRVYHRTIQDLCRLQDHRRGALRAEASLPPDVPAAAPEASKPSPQPPQAPAPSAAPPPTPSSQTLKPKIGSVSQYPRTFDPANPVPSPYYSLSRELLKLAEQRKKQQPQTPPETRPEPRKDAA
jgi:hypothetical protein